MKILHIDSSPFINESVSRELSAMIVTELCSRHPDASVTSVSYTHLTLPTTERV